VLYIAVGMRTCSREFVYILLGIKGIGCWYINKYAVIMMKNIRLSLGVAGFASRTHYDRGK